MPTSNKNYIKDGQVGVAYSLEELNNGISLDGHLFLFNDLILVTLRKTEGYEIVHSISTDNAILNELAGGKQFAPYHSNSKIAPEPLASCFEVIMIGSETKKILLNSAEKAQWLVELTPIFQREGEKEMERIKRNVSCK